MDLKELRKQSIEELKATLKAKESEAQEAVMDLLKEKEKNVSKVRFLKKDIARIKTIINERKFVEQ